VRPGIGNLLGLTIAAEIGEVARFRAPAKLIGYAGLAPRVKQSGDRSRTGALSKAARARCAGRRSKPRSRRGDRRTLGTASTPMSPRSPPSRRSRAAS